MRWDLLLFKDIIYKYNKPQMCMMLVFFTLINTLITDKNNNIVFTINNTEKQRKPRAYKSKHVYIRREIFLIQN